MCVCGSQGVVQAEHEAELRTRYGQWDNLQEAQIHEAENEQRKIRVTPLLLILCLLS